jgi:ubiquinone/menaquinone biosynthesis C-methylase UbiE
LKKFLKTNNPDNQNRNSKPCGTFTTGQVPFMFRQPALTRVTGHTLRPGGLILTQRAVDFCGFDPGDLVLDAGSGYGATARYLFDTYGLQVVGTDMDVNKTIERSNGDRATRHTGPGARSFDFVQSRIPAFPFKSDRFDGIFCECVLSLIPDKQACLEEFYRMLKPNGQLVLTDLFIPEKYRYNGLQTDQPLSCLDGALSIVDLITAVEAAGFTITLMEGHTRFLKQLAGQIVFEHGSLDNFWKHLSGSGGDSQVAQACRTGTLKPGYGLFIASKYE